MIALSEAHSSRDRDYLASREPVTWWERTRERLLNILPYSMSPDRHDMGDPDLCGDAALVLGANLHAIGQRDYSAECRMPDGTLYEVRAWLKE